MSMGSVDVNRDNIRPFEGALPVFRLRERSRAGVDHVLELAGRVAANPEHRQLSDSVTGVYQDKRLVAFADAGTGEASMFPQLELLTPGEGLDERARAAAAELSENNELFPADRTSRQVLDPTVLRGSRASRRRTDEAAAYLALARIRRHVEGISVVGALVKGRPRLRNNRPTIGRYVVRQDNAGWVTSANSFLSGLSASSLLNPSFAPVDRQYYWAEPRLFTDENHEFVDGVEVALTEVHGNWGLFTTLKNNADFVRLDGIPSDGYGGADGTGALAYWILHSCEVIPTSADSATSYDVWWNIFNGLHTALGYRTEMWINDEITSRFGFWAGLGAPMISNWLTTIINDDSYSPTDTYFDGNVNMTEPMGRPSAVTVFGHSDDTIFDTASLPRPSVLQQWWFDN